MKTKVMPLFIGIFLIFGCTTPQAIEENIEPEVFSVEFANDVWDGKNLPPGEQCLRWGGENPSSPELLIKGIPPETNAIILLFVRYLARYPYPLTHQVLIF